LTNQVELFSEQLASEQKELILERAAQCVYLANKTYGVDLPVPNIRFSVKGTAWGYYQRRGKKIEIRFNPLLFARYFQEGIEDTVPHEIAHYFVDSMYTGRPKPHGKEWREVMHVFGIENPRATSNYDTTGLDVRKQTRIKYRCSCQTHEVSKTRHNRMLRGSKYQCISCHDELELCHDQDEMISAAPTTQVSYDNGSGRRKQQRIRYRCACEIHEVSKTRHNRMLRGTVYQCRICNQELELYVEPEPQASDTSPATSSSEVEAEVKVDIPNDCQQQTYLYSCACEIHEVDSVRHERMANGRTYECQLCDQELALYREDGA